LLNSPYFTEKTATKIRAENQALSNQEMYVFILFEANMFFFCFFIALILLVGGIALAHLSGDDWLGHIGIGFIWIGVLALLAIGGFWFFQRPSTDTKSTVVQAP